MIPVDGAVLSLGPGIDGANHRVFSDEITATGWTIPEWRPLFHCIGSEGREKLTADS